MRPLGGSVWHKAGLEREKTLPQKSSRLKPLQASLRVGRNAVPLYPDTRFSRRFQSGKERGSLRLVFPPHEHPEFATEIRVAPDSPSYVDNAVTLGKGTLASRLLGFLRDAAIAALLGGGWVADALLVSFRLPFIARTVLAEGAFAYTLVPAFRSLKDADAERAWAFVRSTTLALFVFFCLFVVFGALFPDNIALIFAPGFHAAPEVLGLASGFMALAFVSLPLVSGAAVSSAALMAEGRFGPPAYASAVFNLVVILAAGAAWVLSGPGGTGAPYMLCGGVVAAGVVQWGYQTFFLRRQGFVPCGPTAFRDPVFTRSLRALPGSVFAVSGHHANLLVVAFLASFLAEGSISALYFAERLVLFPLGVIGASTGLAALSDLAALAPSRNREGRDAAADRERFTERLAMAGRATLFFALPAAVGAACLAFPLTDAIFGHGEFGPEALSRTGYALLAYLAGLPALALARPLLAALSALGDASAPTRAALAGLFATAVLGALSLALNAPWALALSVSLAAWLNAALLLRSLAKRGFSPLSGRVWIARVSLACAVMAACVVWTAGGFSSSSGKLAAVPLGVVVYFAAAFLLRLEEVARIFRSAAVKIRNRRAG